jgi:hypothetical protein
LALGKEHWRFKDLEDQLNMYRQQWQADQQTNIIAEKEKLMIEIITIPMEDAVVLAKAILAAEDAEDVEEAVVAVVEEERIVSI